MSTEEPPEWFKKWEADKKLKEREARKSGAQTLKLYYLILLLVFVVFILYSIATSDPSRWGSQLGPGIAGLLVLGGLYYISYMSTIKRDSIDE